MARPSTEQWELLLQCLAGDRELIYGEFTAPNGAIRIPLKWEEIARKVNAVPGATVSRTGEQWKAAWIALRGRARKSCRELAAYRRGTGGGPDVDVAGLGLNPMYETVLDLTGITAAVGTKCPDPLQIQLNRLDAEDGIEGAVVQPNADVIPELCGEEPLHPLLMEMSGMEAALAGSFDEMALSDSPLAEAGLPRASASISSVCGPSTKDELGAAELAANVKQEASVWEDFVVMPADEDGLCALGIPQVQIKKEPFGGYVVKQEAKVETITLDDTPVKQVHTPPRGSGFTPSGKRRQPAVTSSHPENSDQDGVSDCSIRSVLERNNEVLKQVIELLHSMKF